MDRKTFAGTPEFWTQVLGLEGFEVVSHQHDAEQKVWRFTVVPENCAGVWTDAAPFSA